MMRKRTLVLWMALALALGAAPTALAAAEPALICEFLRDNETAFLTLEDLDGSDVYGVQLELTLEGEYPDCVFTPDSRTAYAPACGLRVSRGRTHVTVYLTDRDALNGGDVLEMGELDLGGYGADAFPETARIILLGEDLKPLTGGMTGTADVEAFPWEDEEPSRPGIGTEEPVQPPSQPDAEPQDPSAPVYLPFTDVSAADWFYEAVGYVYAKGMMRGLSENTFAPYATTDRAMIVTILHRLEGSPAALPAAFTDVSEGQYYAVPVAWASSAGIVEGYEDATFRPESPITREQLAAILYRYARYKGLDVSVTGDLGRFPDASSVSLYASDAMSWAVGSGLIAGLDGALQPGGAAGRAQVAVILQRLCAGLLQMP